MSKELLSFYNSHPLWAILIIILIVLPIMGAVAHIILKALGRPGIEPEPPAKPESIDDSSTSEKP